MEACESCGWAAAVGAMLLAGSFGVPIKSETARRLDIDPMVFQSYKTGVCFLVAGTSLWLLDHPFRFTPWGIVSGLFWVPGGVGTVLSVKLAGLAIAIAVCNSCIALVSFSWGIFIFREAIHSRVVALVGVCLMILGFSGMSYYSTRSGASVVSEAKTTQQQQEQQQQHTSEHAIVSPRQLPTRSSSGYSRRQVPSRSNSGYSTDSLTTTVTELGESIESVEEARLISLKKAAKENLKSSNHTERQTHSYDYDHSEERDDSEAHDEGEGTSTSKTQNGYGPGGLRHRQAHHLQHHANEAYETMTPQSKSLYSSSSDYIIPMTTTEDQRRFINVAPQSSSPDPTDLLLTVGDWKITRRQAGITLAIFNGCWGGSVMVPMKFCPDKSITNGIGYVWSFSIGALIINAGLWIFRYMWLLVDTKSAADAYRALPSFHLREMWRPGGLSGLLYSLGNLCSILSVEYLGEGVGYCVVQASMLVSGLWGIFLFKEVKGAANVAKWFLSAMVTISGILLLSYEHHAT